MLSSLNKDSIYFYVSNNYSMEIFILKFKFNKCLFIDLKKDI